MTPSTLKGKDFETLLMTAAKREESNGLLTMGRYGVQGMVVADKSNGGSRTLLVPSLPDFEGCLMGGRQFNIEAKVCGDPSFPLDKKFIKPRQVSHMLSRSKFGVPCFVLIHFTKRETATASWPAFTVALPVNDEWEVWQRFVDIYAESKDPTSRESISRDTALEKGQWVPWHTPKGCRTPTPDLLSFLAPSDRSAEIVRMGTPASASVPKAKPQPVQAVVETELPWT
jgi:penicillin-binding protein-related factor A (putative recombinase)